MRLRGGEHLLLELLALFAEFCEAGRNDDGGLGAARAEFRDQRGYLVGRGGNDGEIRRLWQARDIRMDGQVVQTGMPRIDRKRGSDALV